MSLVSIIIFLSVSKLQSQVLDYHDQINKELNGSREYISYQELQDRFSTSIYLKSTEGASYALLELFKNHKDKNINTFIVDYLMLQDEMSQIIDFDLIPRIEVEKLDSKKKIYFKYLKAISEGSVNQMIFDEIKIHSKALSERLNTKGVIIK